MPSHVQTLRSFARKLSWLLMFRRAVQWTAAWFFVWGVVVLAARIAGGVTAPWLAAGLLGCVPLALLAALLEWRRRVVFAKVRAAYDALNQCGGMIMAEEAADMSSWQERLPEPSAPVLHWRKGRSLGFLGLSALFVAVALGLPDRFAVFPNQRPLEIGKLVGELRAEVEALKDEKILEEKKADAVQKQLDRLREHASALDPNKTWEALDHIKESNSELARQAAEEALAKLSSLTEAQTLASAMQEAGDAGMSEDTATRAAQDLAAMLKSAQLEAGLLKAEIPPELLAQLNSLSKEDLAKLLQAIQFNKSGLGKSLTNLANLKLIDAKFLSECKNAGQCPNPGALSEFLSTCTNGSMSFGALVQSYCRGGIDRGRGDAPMTWQDEASAEGAKFKEHVLPPSSRLSDSEFVGVSRAAPELSGENAVTEHGALAGGQSSGGAANAQVVLPRHKQTVQRFFKRDEKRAE